MCGESYQSNLVGGDPITASLPSKRRQMSYTKKKRYVECKSNDPHFSAFKLKFVTDLKVHHLAGTKKSNHTCTRLRSQRDK